MKKQKVYHFVYKTTNLINQKIYIGKHSTKNLEDGYLGSGKYFFRAIKKYGKENFKREILKQFETSDEAFSYEAKLVTKDFVLREDNYNLKIGGRKGGGGMVPVYDTKGHTFCVFTDDPRYKSGELVQCTSGTATVKDKDGRIFRIAVDDPDRVNYESHNINMATLKDSEGKIYYLDKDDPKIKSLHLVGMMTGRISIRKNNKGKHIDPSELDYYLVRGWERGSLKAKTYFLIDPNGKKYILTQAFEDICLRFNISNSMLRKNIGVKIKKNSHQRSQIAKNTVGWTLLKVEEAKEPFPWDGSY